MGYDHDSAMDVKLRTMLKRRKVDVVTCWSEHLVAAFKQVVAKGAADQAMQGKIMSYRAKIHDLDKSGFIEESEQPSFAHDVAKLMCPTPGPARSECIDNIWETMRTIDSDGDKKISWSEFWRFVTQADAVGKTEEAPAEEQPSVKFSAFALVVLQRADGSFCLVDTDDGWWLIGGAIEFDESPEDAAVRVAREQVGIDVRLEGILRTEFDHRKGECGSRFRTIYLARALNDYDPLKTVPDKHSRAAVWVDGLDITNDNPNIPLAGSEPSVWFDYVLKLGSVYPLEMLTSEGQAPNEI